MSVTFDQSMAKLFFEKRNMRCLDFFNGTYLRECIEAIGSQTFRLGLNFSPVCKHIVPSLPPKQRTIVFTKNINCLDFINDIRRQKS